MKESITIRPAVSSDAPVLSLFRYQMFADMKPQEDLSADKERVIHDSEAWYSQDLARPEHYSLIAEIHGDPVACGTILFELRPPSVHFHTNLAGYILNIYVKPPYRGRKIARGIMEELMNEARRRGAVRVGLHASGLGRPLYEKLGFKPKESYLEWNEE